MLRPFAVGGSGGGYSAEDEYDYVRILKQAFAKHAQVLKSQCPQVVHSYIVRGVWGEESSYRNELAGI